MMKKLFILFVVLSCFLSGVCQDKKTVKEDNQVDELLEGIDESVILKSMKGGTAYQKLIQFFKSLERGKARANTSSNLFPDDYPLFYGGAYLDAEQNFIILVVDSLLEKQKELLKVLNQDDFQVKSCKYSYRELIRTFEHLDELIKDTTCVACKNVHFAYLDESANRIIVFLHEYSEEKIEEFKREVLDSPMLKFDHCEIRFN